MKELKFLKDLPCKLTNVNKTYIGLTGADIYYDKDGNRFAFITFINLSKSPIFFFQAQIREYSNEGKLIKDNELVIPCMFATKGEFVNENPLEISSDTEAIEIYVNKVTFDRKNFINDKLVNFATKEYIEKPDRAPKKKMDTKSTISFDDLVKHPDKVGSDGKIVEELEEIPEFELKGKYKKNVEKPLRLITLALTLLSTSAFVTFITIFVVALVNSMNY